MSPRAAERPDESVGRDAHLVESRKGVRPAFKHTVFSASMRDLRFTASGDVLLTLVVPYSDKHLVVPVSDAYGISLDVEISRRRKGGQT